MTRNPLVRGAIPFEGAWIDATKGRRRMSLAQLQAELERAFETEQELTCFLCIDNGLYSMVVLGPNTHGHRSPWVFEITASKYEQMRRAMRGLGLTSKLRKGDFRPRWAA